MNRSDPCNAIGNGAICNSKGVPLDFVCPLTNEVMVDPVMCIHGYNCEKAAIVSYLEGKERICPVTGLPISIGDFVSHAALRNRIMKWQINVGGNVCLFSEKNAFYDLPEKFVCMIDNGAMDGSMSGAMDGSMSGKVTRQKPASTLQKPSFPHKLRMAFKNNKVNAKAA